MSVSLVMRRIWIGAVAAIGLTVPALAQDAVTTASVNMRAGPGTNFAIVMGLPEGAGVDYVGAGCGGSWCNVIYEGVRGWVSASYLEEIEERPVVRPAPPIYRPAPPVYVPPPVYDPPPVYGRPWRPRPDWDRPRPPRPDWDRPRPPGGWDRPRPDRPPGGWDRPRPPDMGGRPPRPPVVAPPPPSGGGITPLQPPGSRPLLGPPGGIPRGGTGPCANVPVGVPCG